MRTEYLDYLLEVARCESISKAAKKLFIGQTTLSAIINSVETELNMKLFQRSHQGIRLTPQGTQAMMLIEKIANTNRMLLDLNSAEAHQSKVLHLILYPAACCSLSLPLTERMWVRAPGASLCIHEAPYYKTVQQVVSGTAKIALGADSSQVVFSRQCEAEEHHLRYEPLYEDCFCLAVRRDSPYAQRPWADASELLEERLATSHFYPLNAGSPMAQALRRFRHMTVFTSADIIEKAVLRYGMISIVPRLFFYQDPAVERGDIRMIPLAGFPVELTNYLICDERAGLDPPEAALLQEIRDLFQQLPPTPMPPVTG